MSKLDNISQMHYDAIKARAIGAAIGIVGLLILMVWMWLHG